MLVALRAALIRGDLAMKVVMAGVINTDDKYIDCCILGI